jgi:hypothetical protein
MNNILLQALVGTILVLITPFGWTENPKPCVKSGPPSIWVVKSPYPFQAGAEKTFDELYHGPWRTQVDIVLYARPRGQHIAGEIKAGTVVQALLGESIVVHPLRFTAAKDTQVGTGFAGGKVQVATMQKGDAFWVLDSGNEGEFEIWWRCRVVGWDSTEPPYADEDRLKLLGTNEERWVEIRDMKTGLSGWFHDVPAQDGDPKLKPAQPTTKSTG